VVKKINELRDMIEIVKTREIEKATFEKETREALIEFDRVETSNKRHAIFLKACKVLKEAVDKVTEMEKELNYKENLYACSENRFLERGNFGDARIENIKREAGRL
ncbi:MAG: hypothetical protein ACRC0V_11530, partial [Fusobacteriaceae bacterium]